MSDATYYFAESLWPDLAASNTLDASERLARRLATESGAAFAQVVRDDKGRALTPSWLDAIAMAGDPRRGPVAIAASVAHGALGLPHAFDLAARHMTVGDLPHHFPSTVPLNQFAKWAFFAQNSGEDLTPVHVGGMVAALDLSSDGRSLAVLEYWGGQAANTVSVVDLRERQLRFRTPIPQASSVAYSPDGAWILAGRTIVDVASGEAFELPLSGARSVAWWPAHSPSSVLVLEADEPDAPPKLSTFDLETAEAETLGLVQVPYPGYYSINELAVAPDGASALCGTTCPAPPDFAFGAGYRASLLDIAACRIESVLPGFFEVGGVLIEREHRQLAWIDEPPGDPLSVHDSLRHARVELPLPGPDRRERVAGELCQFVEYGLHALDARAGRDFSREILWAWDAMCDLDPRSTAIPALAGRVRELRETISDGDRWTR